MPDEVDLAGTTDAKVWAEEFTRIFEPTLVRRADGKVIIGEEVESLLLGWFANAFCAQLDECGPLVGDDEIRSIAYQCAGAGSVAIMSKPGARNIVMPEQEIIGMVEKILVEHGFRPKEKPEQRENLTGMSFADPTSVAPRIDQVREQQEQAAAERRGETATTKDN